MKLNKNMVGMAMCGLMAFWHAFWSLMVLMGFAQPFLDFIYRLHFLNNPFVVNPFSWGTALMLIVITGVIGYAMGWVFAWVWNMLHKQ